LLSFALLCFALFEVFTSYVLRFTVVPNSLVVPCALCAWAVPRHTAPLLCVLSSPRLGTDWRVGEDAAVIASTLSDADAAALFATGFRTVVPLPSGKPKRYMRFAGAAAAAALRPRWRRSRPVAEPCCRRERP
jgi:hypothetical protein